MKQIEYFNVNGKPVLVEDSAHNRREFEAAGFVTEVPQGGFDRTRKPIPPHVVLKKEHHPNHGKGKE